MTDTPPATPDDNAIAAGTGLTIDHARVPVLDVDDVAKRYPGEPPVQALRGVNLTIGPGELVGIVGPSGSGKTTLLQLMGTLDRPSSGRVRITGLDVATMGDDDVTYLRATRIGFIFQQFFLAEHSTVLENVADGLLYAGIPLKQPRRRVFDALELVGLAGRPHARPTQARPKATSAPNSSPKPSCSDPSAGSSASRWAPPPPPSMPKPSTGRPSSPPRRGPAASPPRSSSVRSPG